MVGIAHRSAFIGILFLGQQSVYGTKGFGGKKSQSRKMGGFICRSFKVTRNFHHDCTWSIGVVAF